MVKDREISELEKLCRASLDAGILILKESGFWPLPSSLRRLRGVPYDSFRNIPEIQKLINHLAADAKIASMYAPSTQRSEPYNYFRIWEQFFLSVLPETEDITLSDEVFAKWYRKFLTELYDEAAIWRTLDTVTGLDLGGASIEFDHVTKLVAPAWGNLDSLVGGQDIYFLDGSLGGYANATIMTTVKIPKKDYAGLDHPPYGEREIGRSLAVIDAIRLVKPGVPRLNYHIQVHLSDFPLMAPRAYRRHEGQTIMGETTTQLTQSDFPTVQELWCELMLTRYKENWPLRFRTDAMSEVVARFSRSYQPQTWLDTVVDLTIALEALFAPRGGDELRHRIATRASWLLGVDDADSVAIYDLVMNMYDIRSSAVHGTVMSEKDAAKRLAKLSNISFDYEIEDWSKLIEPAVESARNVVRKAIRACLRLKALKPAKWPFPEKNGEFDKNIVKYSERDIWQKDAGIRPP